MNQTANLRELTLMKFAPIRIHSRISFDFPNAIRYCLHFHDISSGEANGR
jgi:hypothetical protein